MNLYNLRSTELGSYKITKFDTDLNPESSYDLSLDACSCPQAHRSTCRHRRMLPLFIAKGAVDSGWFLCFETSQWSKPFPEPVSEALPDRATIAEPSEQPASIPIQPTPSPSGIRRRL